jgi:hypothetical protein
MNAWHGDLDFRIPKLPVEMEWEQLVDTALPTGLADAGKIFRPGDVFRLKSRSFALFINRADEKASRSAPPGVVDPDRPPSVAPPVALPVSRSEREADEETS